MIFRVNEDKKGGYKEVEVDVGRSEGAIASELSRLAKKHRQHVETDYKKRIFSAEPGECAKKIVKKFQEQGCTSPKKNNHIL